MTRRTAASRMAAIAGFAVFLLPPPVHQSRPVLRIQESDGSTANVPLFSEQGFEAAPLSAFRNLGWSIARDGARATATSRGGDELVLWAGSAFFRWKGRVLQLAATPYVSDDSVLVPLQIFVDFLPRWFPDRYEFDTTSHTLRMRVPSRSRVGRDTATKLIPDTLGEAPRAARLRAPKPYQGKKVVVIDPGHGGIDPGAMSRSGLREKTVALAIAKDLAKVLRKDPTLEVHMTRTDDHLVPLWDRGAEATKWKGTRPGVFISIHCNSFQGNARGFETYFLSEARTEHEKRVAANENAPLRLEKGQHPSSDLDAILHQLRNLDYQHWSSLLAEMIQKDMAKVSPAPNRGVKQAPLAVITNALMPAVLVEVGYLSNRSEAKMLASSDFQSKAAGAIARAVQSFFERYPPGSGASGAGEDR